MPLTTRTVTATYQSADGTPATGEVWFSPNVTVSSAAEDLVVPPLKVRAQLDAQGSISVALVCTDNAGLLPSGWAYTVAEYVHGVTDRTYLANIPAGSGALDLADISHLETPPATAEYLLLSGGTLTGPLTLSGDPSAALHAATRQYVDAQADGTAASAVAAHEADTTGVHGIADTSALETVTGSAAKVTTHTGATDPHGDRAFTTSAISTHAAAVDPHGDRVASTSALAAHEADTTAVHGIADTGALETAAGATSKVSTHTAAADPHGDRAHAAATYLPLAGGTVSGNLNVTGRLTSLGWALPLPSRAGRQPAWRNPSWSVQFQTGHGWTASGSGVASSDMNDTTDFVRGTQSAKVTSNGTTGTPANLQRTGLPSVDLTGKDIRLILKVDDHTRVSSVNLFVGTSSFTNYFRWRLHSTTASNQLLQSGDWVTVTLSWADVESAAGTYSVTAGAPSTTTGFTDFRIQVIDLAAGASTVHVQAVEFIDATSTTFPEGVVSVCFDDSYASVHDYARPAMDARGIPGTTYSIAGNVGTSTYVTVPQLRSVQDSSGWEIAGHAYSAAAHTNRYQSLTAEAADDDLRSLKSWLVTNGFPSESFAYPGGRFDPTVDGVPVDEIVGRYFSTGRSILYNFNVETYPAAMRLRLRALSGISGAISTGDRANPVTLTGAGGMLDRCQQHGAWLILTFHRIVTGVAANTVECSQADFEAVMQSIVDRGIPTATVSEVLNLYT